MRIYRKTYSNCSELPLFNFIRILTRNDLNQLYSDKDNWLLKPDLKAVWDGIFMEYTELSQDKQGTHIFHLIRELTVLKAKLDLIQLCIDTLGRCTSLELMQPTIKTLKQLSGVTYPFTAETLLKDLEMTAKASKRFIVQYEETLAEYRAISKDEQAKATEMDYMEQIVAIKEHLGISFDVRNTTVTEYIALVKRIKEKSESK